MNVRIRFAPGLRAGLLVALVAVAAGQSVVINEVSSVQSDRLLQFPPGAPPRLGNLPPWFAADFAVPVWWRSAAGPFGFGSTQATNTQAEMLGKTPVLYLRRTFTASPAQAASTNQLELLIDYADGFVAYLNGREVARRNTGAAGSFAWHSQEAFNTRPPGSTETIALGAAGSQLVAGGNLLCIQVHNNTLDDGTLLASPQLRIGGASPQTLVAPGDTWSWFPGTHEPAGGLYDPADFATGYPAGPDWAQPAYDDTTWTQAAGALGYDTSSDYLAQLGTNLTIMRNAAWSLYMRREFNLTQTQLDQLGSTTLTIDWDDGHVLYLNGYELARANLPGAAGSFVAHNQAASGHGASRDGGGNDPSRIATVAVPRQLLRAGRNVVAAQLHNDTLGSSDLLLDLRFSGVSNGTTLTWVTTGSLWRYRLGTSEFAVPAPAAGAMIAPEFVDWLELRNLTAAAVDLSGWHLTDDPDEPLKWTFPAGTGIPADGFLVLACSGRNVTAPAPGGLLHSNFSLGARGEYLALRDAAGSLRDELDGVPDQDPFHTWGRDAAGAFHYLAAGTPGAANAAGDLTNRAAEVDFSLPSGFHAAPLSVALGSATAGAQIRYTLDGSEPTAASPLYAGPFDPTAVQAGPGPGSGLILREFFQWGGYVPPASIPPGATPTSAQLIEQLETPSNVGEYIGHRLRGFLHPPQSGNYQFWIASDDGSELWLSSDEQPSNKTRIAWVAEWTAVREWTKVPSQQSAAIPLVAGRKYYLEVLHGESILGDNLAVGWSGPGLPAGINVVQGRYLSPPASLPAGTTRPPLAATLRARAFSSGMLPGEVRTRSYVAGAPAALASVPAVFLSGPAEETFYNPNGIFSQVGGGFGSGSWQASDVRFDYNFCLMEGSAFERPAVFEVVAPGNVLVERTTAGVRFAGSPWSRPQYQLQNVATSEWNSGAHNKPQINVFFRGDFGVSTMEHDGFIPASRLDEWDTLRLRAGKNDPYNPFIIDEWMRRTFAAMGAPSPQGIIATLFINGHFKSYFNPTERPRESFFREFHRSGNPFDVNYNGAWEDGDGTAYAEMDSFFRSNDFTTLTNYQTGASHWDMANVADYLIINAWGGTQDWPQNNYVFTRERAPGAKWRFSMWDAEGALGVFGNDNSFNTLTESLRLNQPASSISSEWMPAVLVARRAHQNAEFRLLFADRLQKHLFNGGAMTRANMNARWNELRAQAAPVILAVMGQAFNDSYWTNWSNREATLLSQARAVGLWPATLAPAATPFGGSLPAGATVTLANPNAGGTIYYTTSGSDPRATGGGIAGTPYGAPLPVNAPFTLKARVRSAAGEWSPLIEADFGPPPPRIVISEIHYNPPGPDDLTEFVELTNVGGAPAPLNGAEFTEGIGYAFGNVTLAASHSLVLVRNAAAFAAAYPGVPVHGVFTGALENAGETLTLRDITGAVIATVTYDDNPLAGWPAAPDGDGPSLVLGRQFSAATDPGVPAGWRPSESHGGAPGTPDSLAFTGTPGLDADADGCAALLEHALGTSDADPASRPAITAGRDGDGHLTVTFVRRLAADDVVLDAQQSGDLGGWQPAEFVAEQTPAPGWRRVTWRTVAGAPRQFLRVRAVHQP